MILLPLYLINGLISLHETYTEYSVALTGDLITFWRSGVKGQGRSVPWRWRRHPRRRRGIEFHLHVRCYFLHAAI